MGSALVYARLFDGPTGLVRAVKERPLSVRVLVSADGGLGVEIVWRARDALWMAVLDSDTAATEALLEAGDVPVDMGTLRAAARLPTLAVLRVLATRYPRAALLVGCGEAFASNSVEEVPLDAFVGAVGASPAGRCMRRTVVAELPGCCAADVAEAAGFVRGSGLAAGRTSSARARLHAAASTLGMHGLAAAIEAQAIADLAGREQGAGELLAAYGPAPWLVSAVAAQLDACRPKFPADGVRDALVAGRTVAFVGREECTWARLVVAGEGVFGPVLESWVAPFWLNADSAGAGLPPDDAAEGDGPEGWLVQSRVQCDGAPGVAHARGVCPPALGEVRVAVDIDAGRKRSRVLFVGDDGARGAKTPRSAPVPRGVWARDEPV